MGNPFAYNSPLMNTMRKVLDFALLNFLTALCSLPIITAGAAIAAAHYVCVEMRAGECSVATTYITAFKDNLKNGILLWLLILGCLVFGYVDYRLATALQPVMQGIVQVLLIIEGVVLLLAYSWIFPLQARYENKVFHTVKNALILSVAYLPTTILMAIMCTLPVIMLLLSEYTLPLVLLFGFSMPIYWNTGLYLKILKGIDKQKNQEPENDCE